MELLCRVPFGKLSRVRHHRDIIGNSSRENKGTAFENRDFTSEVMRCDRNDDAGHRLLEKQRSCRWIVRGVSPANLSSRRGEAATGDSSENNL